MPDSQGLSNIPYPEPNQPILRIDAYLFMVHSNIVLRVQSANRERLD